MKSSIGGFVPISMQNREVQRPLDEGLDLQEPAVRRVDDETQQVGQHLVRHSVVMYLFSKVNILY